MIPGLDIKTDAYQSVHAYFPLSNLVADPCQVQNINDGHKQKTSRLISAKESWSHQENNKINLHLNKINKLQVPLRAG